LSSWERGRTGKDEWLGKKHGTEDNRGEMDEGIVGLDTTEGWKGLKSLGCLRYLLSLEAGEKYGIKSVDMSVIFPSNFTFPFI